MTIWTCWAAPIKKNRGGEGRHHQARRAGVSVRQLPEAEAVLRAEAKRKNAPLRLCRRFAYYPLRWRDRRSRRTDGSIKTGASARCSPKQPLLLFFAARVMGFGEDAIHEGPRQRVDPLPDRI
jgi:hypothetical protein